jgi:hypothetical protein
MNVYVFENVLQDWSYGMVVIVAESLERAHEIFSDNDGIPYGDN